jgi:predicted PurR-regulated permease PerM
MTTPVASLDSDSPPFPGVAPRKVFLGTLAAVGTALAFLLLYVFADVLLLLFVGIILATAVRPIIGWLRGRGVPQNVATVAVYLALLISVATLLSWFVPMVFDQVQTIGAQIPRNYQQLAEQLRDSPSLLLRRIGERLPERAEAPTQPSASGAVVEQVATAWNYGNWALVALVGIAAVLLIAFFWSLQEERTLRTLQLALPPSRREAFNEFVNTARSKLGAYVRGQVLLCLVIGVLNFVAFVMIGLPYATTFAVLAGIFEAIPVVGPVLAAVAPALAALTTDPSKVIWVLVAALFIQQAENYFLVPRIMENAVGVNPIVTLLALVAFGTLMGFVGAVLAIPLAAIVQLVLDRLLLDQVALEPPPPSGRDAVSVAHYHARDLIQDVRAYLRNKPETAVAGADALEDAIETIATDIDQLLTARFGVAVEGTSLTEGTP